SISAPSIDAKSIHADRFGNLITNLTADELDSWLAGRGESIEIDLNGTAVGGLSRTFSDRQAGEPVVYIGSGGRIEVGVFNGSALLQFGGKANLRITVKS